MFKRTILAIILGALAGYSVTAEAKETYKLDDRHTNIMWFGSHFGFSKSMGQFMEYEGEVTLDFDAPENSSVNIIIEADSVMTGLADFDKHLKNADFLHVEEYPEIRFTSTAVEVTGDSTAKVIGNFTLLGVTKPLTLDVTLNKSGINPYNKKRSAGFTAKASFNRSDFGMNWGIDYGIADKVDILIEAEGIHTKDLK